MVAIEHAHIVAIFFLWVDTLIFDELFYGNINPNEKQFVRNTDFDRAMRTITDSENKLTDLLSGKEQTLFLDFANAQSVVNGITAAENFVSGFRLGERIAPEMISDEGGCLRDIT